MFGNDIQLAVRQSRQTFPNNWILKISVEVAQNLATKFVRFAIKDAASSLGLTLSDGDLDLLADLAIASITG